VIKQNQVQTHKIVNTRPIRTSYSSRASSSDMVTIRTRFVLATQPKRGKTDLNYSLLPLFPSVQFLPTPAPRITPNEAWILNRRQRRQQRGLITSAQNRQHTTNTNVLLKRTIFFRHGYDKHANRIGNTTEARQNRSQLFSVSSVSSVFSVFSVFFCSISSDACPTDNT
jgi:hypothetical protein